MGYDYWSCDGNAGKAPIEEADYCPVCKEKHYPLFKSKLSGLIYCEKCALEQIKEDERDYPGDKGNHKSIQDFEEITL